MGSTAAQVLRPGFLAWLDWRLYSAVEPSCGFAALPRCGSTTPWPAQSTAWGQVRQTCPLNFLARQGPLLCPADGQTRCLGSLLRHHCQQECGPPRSECKPSPFLYHNPMPCGWALQIPPGIPRQWDPSGPPRKCPTALEEPDCSPWTLFCYRRNPRSRGPSRGGAGPALGSGHVTAWLLLLPLYCVLLSLCGPGVASALTPSSGIFTVMSCAWRVASWCSCEGYWSREWSVSPC